jgi:hypothetical protein
LPSSMPSLYWQKVLAKVAMLYFPISCHASNDFI